MSLASKKPISLTFISKIGAYGVSATDAEHFSDI